MKQLVKVTGYPFVNHVDQSARPVREINIALFFEGYHSSSHDVSRYGIQKVMGYRYDLKPYLKSYLVKQHGDWCEYYAPNKTALRKLLGSGILRIVEI